MFGTIRHLFSPQTSNNHRPRILHTEGLIVLILILIGLHSAISFGAAAPNNLPSILGFASSITASSVVDQTNTQRAAIGISTLTVNSKLVSAAIAKGNNMCEQQYWAHISPTGTTPWNFMKNAGYNYAVAGENLARDFMDTTSVIDAWMASPTHKANIVDGRFNEIGVAVVDCKFLGEDTTLVIQMFGKQQVAVVEPKVDQGAISLQVPQAQAQAPLPSASPKPETQAAQLPPTPFPVSGGTRVFSTLQLTKAVSLSVLILLGIVLSVDMWLTHSRNTVRIAGKNMAHLLFIAGIVLVVLVVKSGVIQ